MAVPHVWKNPNLPNLEKADFEKYFGGLWIGAHPTAKAADGIEKLRRYASDRFVPELARGTRLHLILFPFKGTELVRLEEIPL